MNENMKMPNNAETKPLTDEQLSEVSGGGMEKILVHSMGFKRCAADPAHVYAAILDACPECGSKEFTRA